MTASNNLTLVLYGNEIFIYITLRVSPQSIFFNGSCAFLNNIGKNNFAIIKKINNKIAKCNTNIFAILFQIFYRNHNPSVGEKKYLNRANLNFLLCEM